MDLTSRLQAAIDDVAGRDILCGAIRISKAGHVLFERAYGDACVQLSVPNSLNTRFHIASMTKMFISAAVVRLWQEGVLSVGAHPSDYVPELKGMHRDVTLHRLLTHTAGLSDVYDVPDLRHKVSLLVQRQESLLDYIAGLPPLSPPGEKWRYSTTGYLVLGYILERVAAAPFSQVIADLFLAPLGMADTGPDNPFLVNRARSFGHISSTQGWRNAPNDALAEIEAPREFFSTVGDIDRWANAMLAGEVLSEAGLALTFSRYARIGPFGDLDPTFDYGYGWFLGDSFRWIGGITPGFKSALWQYPQQRLNVTMLWNNERTNSQRIFAALRPLLLAE